MAFKLGDLQTHAKYKKELKKEVNAMAQESSKFYYFEKFPFTDTSPGPLLLLGSLAVDKFFKAAKNTNAPIAGRGVCAKVGEDLEFALNLGKLPFKNVKKDMGNPTNLKLVKELSNKAPAAVPQDEQLEDAAKSKLINLVKQFDAIKGRMMDEERRDLRQYFGRIQKLMKAGGFAAAITEMKLTEKELAKVGNALRKDKQSPVDKSSAAFIEAEQIAADSMEELKRVQDEISELEKLIDSSESTVQAMSKRKGKGAQRTVQDKQAIIRSSNEKLAVLKETIVGLVSSAKGDKKVAKALLKSFMAAQSRLETLTREALKEPGKIKDNPSLKKAQEDISNKVADMADASEWQKEQLKGEGHGTGRHGAQTGVEKQARRVASDVTPDQAHNPSGTAQYTARWKTTIKYEEKGGKRVVKKKAEVVRTVIDELNNTFGASKSSIFLNPVLEKEAVDKAMKIANEQCLWTQWKDGSDWKNITDLTIVVPSPKTALGYGYCVEKRAAFVKTSANQAASHVKNFEAGKMTIDELLEKLNVQIAPDSTGVGAAMLRHARVVLTRSAVDAPWKNKTQIPTDDAPAWETDKQKRTPLNGKRVKSDTIAETTAPMFS